MSEGTKYTSTQNPLQKETDVCAYKPKHAAPKNIQTKADIDEVVANMPANTSSVPDELKAEVAEGLTHLAATQMSEPNKHVAQTGAILADENMYMPARTKSSIHNTMDLGLGGIVDAEMRKRRRKRWFISLGAACVVASLASFGILTKGFGLLLQGNMPDVVGYTKNSAESLLAEDGYSVEIQEQQTNEPEQDGMVLASSPSTGEATTKGQKVVLKVAVAKCDTQEVPDFTGMTEDEAIAAIAQTNFFVKDDISYAYSPNYEKGTVISQGPIAGTKRTKGTKIDLVVSAGPNPKNSQDSSVSGVPELTVPDVIGMTYKDAKQLLVGMGLTVERGADIVTDNAINGTIVAMDPDVDSDVKSGDTVVLHLASPATNPASN